MARSKRFRLALIVPVLAGLLVGVLVLTPVGAHVTEKVGHLWNDHLKAKTDQRYVRRYFAVIDMNGNVVRDRGVASADFLNGGRYEVIFNRKVRKCAYVATLGKTAANEDPDPGEVAVAPRDNKPKGVAVSTYDSSGAAFSASFHLAVIC